jgi:hypothetical protein
MKRPLVRLESRHHCGTNDPLSASAASRRDELAGSICDRPTCCEFGTEASYLPRHVVRAGGSHEVMEFSPAAPHAANWPPQKGHRSFKQNISCSSPSETPQSEQRGTIVNPAATGSASGTMASSTLRASCWVSLYLLERLSIPGLCAPGRNETIRMRQVPPCGV